MKKIYLEKTEIIYNLILSNLDCKKNSIFRINVKYDKKIQYDTFMRYLERKITNSRISEFVEFQHEKKGKNVYVRAYFSNLHKYFSVNEHDLRYYSYNRSLFDFESECSIDIRDTCKKCGNADKIACFVCRKKVCACQTEYDYGYHFCPECSGARDRRVLVGHCESSNKNIYRDENGHIHYEDA